MNFVLYLRSETAAKDIKKLHSPQYLSNFWAILLAIDLMYSFLSIHFILKISLILHTSGGN
jgi:hypothetical protein